MCIRDRLTPEHQASIWADYDWSVGPLAGFGIGFGARFIGSSDNVGVGNLAWTEKEYGHSSAYTCLLYTSRCV